MLKWEGRDILETLPEIVDPKHTVVLMHDIQNDNTGPGGVFEKDGRRIDVTHLIAPIARFHDEARSDNVRVKYTAYRYMPNFQTFTAPRVRDLYPILSDPVRREGKRPPIHVTG